MKIKRFILLILAIALLTSACGLTAREAADTAGDTAELLAPEDTQGRPESSEPEGSGSEDTSPAAHPAEAEPEDTRPSDEPEDTRAEGPEYGEYYYDVENVVLYLETYGELPDNFITKDEARELGWSGGSVEDYLEGAAIGGDRFGNYEGLLPKAKGRIYTECDIDTLGYGSRGARRLVFSNDGLYFYTSDHYESFSEVTVEDGRVSW